MKYIALCFLFSLALNFSSSGQNLVPNGSFEEVINCPTTLAALHNDCADWYAGIQVPGLLWNEWPSPDWYHTCSPAPELNPPATISGYQEPCDGEAYAGIISYALSNSDYREIISVELTEQLNFGELYRVRFQIVRSNELPQSGFATNNVGLRFTTFSTWYSEELAASNWAHYRIEELITDTLNWTLIEFEFLADSTYGYMHIGNFFDDENSLIANVSDENYATWAYYLIDCVEVFKNVNTSSLSHIEGNSTAIYPNPAVDFVIIPEEVHAKSIKIFDSTGRIAINLVDRNITERVIDISRLSKGLYILEIENESNSVSKIKLIKTK